MALSGSEDRTGNRPFGRTGIGESGNVCGRRIFGESSSAVARRCECFGKARGRGSAEQFEGLTDQSAYWNLWTLRSASMPGRAAGIKTIFFRKTAHTETRRPV